MVDISYNEISGSLKNAREVLKNISNLRNYVVENMNTVELKSSLNELERKLVVNTFLDINDSDSEKINKLHSILICMNDLKNKVQIDSNLKFFYSHIQNILENEYKLLYQQLCEHPLYYLESDHSILDSWLGTCYSCKCIECNKVTNVPVSQLKNKLICDYENWFNHVPLKPSVPFSEVQEAFAEMKKDESKKEKAVPIMIRKYVRYKKEL